MSRHQYQDDCPGCRPAGMTLDGSPLPLDHPINAALGAAWQRALPRTRQAWHRVTCLNSRAPVDLALCRAFLKDVRKL